MDFSFSIYLTHSLVLLTLNLYVNYNVALFIPSFNEHHTCVFLPVPHGLLEHGSLAARKNGMTLIKQCLFQEKSAGGSSVQSLAAQIRCHHYNQTKDTSAKSATVKTIVESGHCLQNQ